MSDPNTQPDHFEIYKLTLPLVGAMLSILGGFAAVFIRARLEKKQEIEYIKIGLKDELYEICSIIDHLTETYTRTQVLSNTYLNNLSKNTEAFTQYKQRLFLINNETLRRQIVAFYKKLNEVISESVNKVGTLGENPSGAEHEKIVSKFTSIATEARTIGSDLDKYKYRLLWLV